MGAFDMNGEDGEGEYEQEDDEHPAFLAYAMLHEVSTVHQLMDADGQRRVLRRVEMSGALPVSRDTPSYAALLGILWGGGGAALDSVLYGEANANNGSEPVFVSDEEDEDEEEESPYIPGGAARGVGPRRGEVDEMGDTTAGGFGETTAFRNARHEAKAEAAARVAEHEDDKAAEALAMAGHSPRDLLSDEEDGPNPFSEGLGAMNMTFSRFQKTQAGKNPFSDTMLASELNGMDGELERLDDMVAADLAQCQQELADLEREVRMLQNGGDESESESDEGEWSDEDEDGEEGEEREVIGGGPTSRMPMPSYLMDGSMAAAAAAARTPAKSVLQGSFANKLEGAIEHMEAEVEADDDEATMAALEAEMAREATPVKTVAEVAEGKHAMPSPSVAVSTRSPFKAEDEEQEQAAAQAAARIAAASAAADAVIARSPCKQEAPEAEGKFSEEAEAEAEREAAASKASSKVSGAGYRAPEEKKGEEGDRAGKKRGKGKGKKRSKKGGKTSRPGTANTEASAKPQRSLLGDLPTLANNKVGEGDIRNFVDLKLELPQQRANAGKGGKKGGNSGFLQGAGGGLLSPSGKKVSKGAKSEFACEINGHLMKDPVRAPNGHVFEKATILLWLETRGSVCPLTGDALCAEDLVPDKELRSKIMRHHISHAFKQDNGASELGDDLYDF